MDTKRTSRIRRRVAAAAALLSVGGVGGAAMMSGAPQVAVRAPGQISISTANACYYGTGPYQHEAYTEPSSPSGPGPYTACSDRTIKSHVVPVAW
ncbi:MAG: hypothetical protein QOC92_788 [Acidimicrobiaceae bacterium]|jgi:hypothetical protein